MKAVCWSGKNRMRVENVPEPRILNPCDAIVRITAPRYYEIFKHKQDECIKVVMRP